jgi:hypothetical protein
MADAYDKHQYRDFLNAEVVASLSHELEAHADPVFHALAEGKLEPLIYYLRNRGDINSVPLSRALANHLADMLQVDGHSLFRLTAAGRIRGERGRAQRLRVFRSKLLIGYCALRLITEVRGAKNAKWAKGEVGAEFGAEKTNVDTSLQLVRRYSSTARNRNALNHRFSKDYEIRFGQRVSILQRPAL